MRYPDQLRMARAVAIAVHAGQRDKDDKEPHFAHVERVARQLEGFDAVVGYLHDVIEDSRVTSDDLLAMGFPVRAVADVVHLTHLGSETYEDYIERVRGSGRRARAVKLADLNDNVARARRSGRLGLVRRYERAIKLLGGA